MNLNHSRPLDIHVWSEHGELGLLVNEIWLRYFQENVQSGCKRGPKPKAAKKAHLKVLLLDLYVGWLNDPTMYLAVHMSKSGWKASSRYNALHFSSKMIDVIHQLYELEYLEFHKGYEGKLSRIRPHERLQMLFHSINIPVTDITFNYTQEVLELRADVEADRSSSKPKLEYVDTQETLRMRKVLLEYNKLLSESHLDVSSLEEPYFDRTITKGIRAGDTVRVYVDHRNIFIKRVFNNSSWKLGGRFYGGWWQQIDKELRADIVINKKPTVEIDFKAMHVALLFAEIGAGHDYDPYSLCKTVFPEDKNFDQRSAVKQLALMAINAKSRTKAFSAFRADQPTGHSFKRLTNSELSKLLDAFINQYPKLEPYLCTGKGLELMFIDSCIAEYVISHFTKLAVPILCIHDSFIVPYDQVLELRAVMSEAGNKYAKRFMFTDKDGYGLDEWLSAYENTGEQPIWAPKQLVRCAGYDRRLKLSQQKGINTT